MNKKLWRVLALLVVVLMVLTACATATEPAAPEPTAEPEEPAAPEPTAEPEEPAAPAEASEVNIVHYFSGDLGLEGMSNIFNSFKEAQSDYVVVDNTTGHEDFKTQILVMLAGDNPPDIFSYWAGARTQFVVDAGSAMELDDFWAENDLDAIIPAGLKSAAFYNGKIYLVPQNAHITGFWYNPKVMEEAGITKMPETWDELLETCETLKEFGVAPISLGSMNRWPAQYWFDYTLSYTAGLEYRNKLMAGEASYTDPEVVTAMEHWKELIDNGCFHPNSNAYDWTDSSDQVANGDAAMQLMGTWLAGYYDGNGLVAGEDYDFFPFPTINPDLPVATFGGVDSWIIPAGAENPDGAKALILHFLKPEPQATWAIAQGALAAVNNVPDDTYNVVTAKAAEHLTVAQFFGGYDLSTTPPMAEGGLNMFAQFVNDPSAFLEYLQQTEDVAIEVFEK